MPGADREAGADDHAGDDAVDRDAGQKAQRNGGFTGIPRFQRFRQPAHREHGGDAGGEPCKRYLGRPGTHDVGNDLGGDGGKHDTCRKVLHRAARQVQKRSRRAN